MLFDVEVFTGRAGSWGWNTDTVTGSRRRALERRAELYARIGQGGLRGARITNSQTGEQVYPERWER